MVVGENAFTCLDVDVSTFPLYECVTIFQTDRVHPLWYPRVCALKAAMKSLHGAGLMRLTEN